MDATRILDDSQKRNLCTYFCQCFASPYVNNKVILILDYIGVIIVKLWIQCKVGLYIL